MTLTDQDVRMAFAPADVDQLLAETGRMCAICNRMHGVQVHHLIPQHEGGPDTYENMIPLCPNCHDEVHTGYAPGRVTRIYSTAELAKHLERTKKLASLADHLRPGGATWEADVARLQFFVLCLDRPAFRHQFHQELSFVDFDTAMEDTVLALNTGFWRTRDGTLIERGEGKTHLVNPAWRQAMDEIVRIIGEVRADLRRALGLDLMLMRLATGDPGQLEHVRDQFDWDSPFCQSIDQRRDEAIAILNGVLEEAGLNPLPPVGQ